MHAPGGEYSLIFLVHVLVECSSWIYNQMIITDLHSTAKSEIRGHLSMLQI